MTSIRKILVAAALGSGVAWAAEPTDVQDPPGEVGVRQPAGVTRSDRSTDRDTTDTLRGGGRTEVTRSLRPDDETSAPEVSASESRGEAVPGEEARASFERGAATDRSTEETRLSGEDPDTAESTSLGTDTGHGTGTELPAPRGAR